MSEILTPKDVQSFRRAGDTATFLESVEANKLGRTIMALADSHEALRAERDALRAVTLRLLDGWTFSEIVDGEGAWCRGTLPDGYEAAEEQWMTPAEAACINRLMATEEASDG